MKRRELNATTAYFEAVVTTGHITLENGDELLIDSGLDDSVANKIMRQIGQGPLHLLSTHHHADHVGGNAKLQKSRLVTTYASRVEKALIEAPLYEGYYLYGAHPFEAIDSKFIHAKPSQVDVVIEPGASWTVGGSTFQTLDLSGHSPGMVGLVTKEGVAFCADALLGEAELKKHRLSFLYDVKKTLLTMDRLIDLEAEVLVLAHGGLCRSPRDLIEKNKEHVLEASERILGLFSQGEALSFGALRQRVSKAFDLKERHPGPFLLNSSVVKAHLSYWVDKEALTCFVNEKGLLFERK